MQQRGFTLVELLVALMVMALLAIMSWRGLDGMVRANAITQAHTDAVVALQNSLAQWGADLDAMVDTNRILVSPPRGDAVRDANADSPASLDWNGQVMRIVRSSEADQEQGLRVVAWSMRQQQGQGLWLRWRSDLLRTPAQLQTAWTQAALWAQNPDDAARTREVPLVPLLDWKIYYYRNDAWSNPLSSSESAGAWPQGVRLQLTLPENASLPGSITRDWVAPTIAGNKS